MEQGWLAQGRRSAISRARQHQKLLRFLVVGLVNTIFGYSVFAVTYLVSHQHNLALVVATVLGVIFNFFTTGRLVFGNKSWRALLPFCAAYGIALAINFAVLNLLLLAGLPALLAQAISLPIVVIVSYVINARYVFRPTAKDAIET